MCSAELSERFWRRSKRAPGGVGQYGRGEEKKESSQKNVHYVQPGEKLLRHLIRRMQTKVPYLERIQGTVASICMSG